MAAWAAHILFCQSAPTPFWTDPKPMRCSPPPGMTTLMSPSACITPPGGAAYQARAGWAKTFGCRGAVTPSALGNRAASDGGWMRRLTVGVAATTGPMRPPSIWESRWAITWADVDAPGVDGSIPTEGLAAGDEAIVRTPVPPREPRVPLIVACAWLAGRVNRRTALQGQVGDEHHRPRQVDGSKRSLAVLDAALELAARRRVGHERVAALVELAGDHTRDVLRTTYCLLAAGALHWPPSLMTSLVGTMKHVSTPSRKI
eukprot:7387108-Prymnesium_polylepis.1